MNFVVFGNRDVFIVLDSMAGAFLFLDKEDARIEIVPMEEYNASELSEVGITEKDFVPFDRESMPQYHGAIRFPESDQQIRPHRSVLH